MYKNHHISRIAVAILAIIFLSGCGQNNSEKKNSLFSKLDAAQSGIDFSNDISDSDSTNSFINEFGYMGGGVGIGDFNNDGLKDIFFTGNQVSCRIYINKGNNKFEDITEKAGLNTNVWATGVSIVDINNDGYDDIYVCVFGKNLHATVEKSVVYQSARSHIQRRSSGIWSGRYRLFHPGRFF